MDTMQVTTQRNKDAVRRVFEEGFNLGRLDAVDQSLSPDATDRHPFEPGEDFRGHLKGVITMLRDGLPDLHMTVEDLIGEGDRVAARVTLTGTHTGANLFGMAPQGAAVCVEQFHIISFDEHGRGRSHWANVAIDDLIRQLNESAPATAGSTLG